MNPLLDQLGATIVWLSVFAPMLWAGLTMVLDPAGFGSLLGDLIEVLHRFVREFRAPWRQPFLPTTPAAAMPWTDAWARPGGMVLIVISLAGLWEAPS